jgi:sulfite exporter TauE/SafE
MPVDLPVLLAALLAGALGGLHCVAMCGALATGLPACGAAGQPLRTALLLNLGRVGGYTLAGAVVGGLGGGLLGVVRIDGLAPLLRAAVGVVMVAVALRLWRPRWFAAPRAARLGTWRAVQALRARCVPARGPLRPLLLGVFWGWLPCGLSTMLLAAAWLQASALHGALLMAAFGLGTLPLLAMLSWTGARGAGLLARPGLRGAAAGVVATLGVLTLAAPLLAHVPAAQAVLTSLGCRSLVG